MNHDNPNAASPDLCSLAARPPAQGWRRALTALCRAAASLGAQAQTAQVLKNLVADHGSLAAGDVVFTNFRLPLLQPGQIIPVGDTFPVLYDGADGSVQASVAADGKIKLVLTPIDTATGLPKPYAVNAKPGALLPTDHFRYIEYDVVVTNPQRRLHGVDRAFGPGGVHGRDGQHRPERGDVLRRDPTERVPASCEGWR
jgi:hypothetical protein